MPGHLGPRVHPHLSIILALVATGSLFRKQAARQIDYRMEYSEQTDID